MFKLFMCAICQVEMKPEGGISIHAGSTYSGKLRPWDGLFLCLSCQEKKDAMEGKRPSGGIAALPLSLSLSHAIYICVCMYMYICIYVCMHMCIKY